MAPEVKRRLFGPALMCAVLLASTAHGADGDDQIFSFFQMDQNEIRFGTHRGYAWEAQGWIGTDYDKAFVKGKGETEFGGAVEAAELQLLYSRLVSDFFDAQVGLRFDLEPEPARGYAVLGLHGLAPQFFEVDAAVFLGEQGRLSARIEAEYDVLITQRLVLQPLLELTFFAQDVDELAVAAGPAGIEAGLRLRYEFAREFAPYVGVAFERDLFETAARTRASGGEVESLSLVTGIRLFF